MNVINDEYYGATGDVVVSGTTNYFGITGGGYSWLLDSSWTPKGISRKMYGIKYVNGNTINIDLFEYFFVERDTGYSGWMSGTKTLSPNRLIEISPPIGV